MSADSRSREIVKERLALLEKSFGQITINQTTFEVSEDRYERAAEHARDGDVAIHAVVRNETDEVLLSETDGGWAIPRGRASSGEDPERAAKRIVQETASVDCSIQDVTSATITGICNSDDPSAETVYRLSIVFTAEISASSGQRDDELRWETTPEVTGQEFV